MHDPRIGRFFAIDPLAPKYPHNSPYAFSENTVIDHVELEGLEKAPAKNVHYYNMRWNEKTESFEQKDKPEYSSTNLTLKTENAVIFNSSSGRGTADVSLMDYGHFNFTINVYTYWNGDEISFQKVMGSGFTFTKGSGNYGVFDQPYTREYFSSADEAAIAWANQYNPLSVENNKEYGANLYSKVVGDETKYFFDVTVQGTQGEIPVDRSRVNIYDEEVTLVGEIHSHSAHSKTHLPYFYSDSDIKGLKRRREKYGLSNSYLVNPYGHLLRMTISDVDNSVKLISKNINGGSLPSSNMDLDDMKSRYPDIYEQYELDELRVSE